MKSTSLVRHVYLNQYTRGTSVDDLAEPLGFAHEGPGRWLAVADDDVLYGLDYRVTDAA
jgi:hypothetical protein